MGGSAVFFGSSCISRFFSFGLTLFGSGGFGLSTSATAGEEGGAGSAGDGTAASVCAGGAGGGLLVCICCGALDAACHHAKPISKEAIVVIAA